MINKDFLHVGQEDEFTNELSPELLSVHSLNFATAANAPARGVMFAGHFAQRPVIDGSEPNLIQTGAEEEFGKYTFSIKMPEDGTIMRVIPRFPAGIGDDQIEFNPETLVIYRSHESGQLDYFTVPYHASHHPTFGFKYEQKDALDGLAVGRDFAKDTIFADSPAVHGESHYTYGKNLNIVQMSHPNVGLDGYVISRDVLKHLQFKIYETRSIEFGASEFPLNICGTEDRYQSFPEIGEYIRKDGLLMAMRRFDPYLAPALLSRKDLQTVDYLFDTKVYARPGIGRIVDISVIHSENVNRQLPPEMTPQLTKYSKAIVRFHRDVVQFEEQQIAENRRHGGTGKIKISQRLQRLIVKSKAIINHDASKHRPGLTLVYRKEPLDAWRITFTIEYSIIPDRGFKITCCSGGVFIENQAILA